MSVASAMPSALKWMSLNASGQPRIAARGPPSAPLWPTKGRIWIRMMMTPMPDMNPEVTEYGV